MVQLELFPDNIPPPALYVVCMPDTSEELFKSIIMKSNDSLFHIFDFRLVPSFFTNLNRTAAFELFELFDIVYADIAGIVEITNKEEQRMKLQEMVDTAFYEYNNSCNWPTGSLMVLTDCPEISKSVMELMPQVFPIERIFKT